MNMKDFIERLDGGSVVALSQFNDRNGFWAKDPMTCTHVYVVFDDAESYTITYDTFKGLTKEQQLKLQHAPSSPPA